MSPRLARVNLHIAAVLFGVSALFGKFLAVSPSIIVFGRGLFGLLTLSVVLLVTNKLPWRSVSRRDIFWLMGIGASLAVHWIIFFTAVQVGGVAAATLGFATFPAFTALLEHFVFGQHMSRRDWGVIVLVSIGMVLVGPLDTLNIGALQGLGWGVLSGATYAAIAVANKHRQFRGSGVQLSWWQCLAIVLVLAPFSADGLPDLTQHDWLMLASLGVLCTGVAYTLFISALKSVRAHSAAVVTALEPVYAIAGAWWLFGQVPGLLMTLGGVLILGAVAWSAAPQTQAKA